MAAYHDTHSGHDTHCQCLEPGSQVAQASLEFVVQSGMLVSDPCVSSVLGSQACIHQTQTSYIKKKDLFKIHFFNPCFKMTSKPRTPFIRLVIHSHVTLLDDSGLLKFHLNDKFLVPDS